MSDLKENEKDTDELTLYEFEEDDEDDASKDGFKKYNNPQFGMSPEYEAKLSLTQQELAEMKSKVSKFDLAIKEADNMAEMHSFENHFADVDDRIKAYNKELIKKVNTKTFELLNSLQNEINSLKEKQEEEKIHRINLAKDIVSINDTFFLEKAARRGLEDTFGNVDIIDQKTGKKKKLGQKQVDSALKLFADRYQTEAKFAQIVDNVYRDKQINPQTLNKRIGILITDTFKQKIEEHIKNTKKGTKKEEISEPTKKSAESSKASENEDQKELTAEEKETLRAEKRSNLERILKSKKMLGS